VTIGERIKYARARRALSQDELAKLAKIGRANLSKLETDQATPRASTARRLAQVLGVDPGWILVGDHAPFGAGVQETSEAATHTP
jgi:transcriptional regulator with XRE-family HTH domain